MNKKEKSKKGNVLKAIFNQLWDESIKRNEGKLPYRDIVRIADAIKHEGPEVLERESLPAEIEAGLELAVAVVDPDKIRTKQHLQHAFSLLSGTSGIWLVAVCLGAIINPGMWAAFVAFIAGGVAAGPLAVAGVAAGLAALSASLYVSFRKMQPNERAVLAHKCVSKGIEAWINNDGSCGAAEKTPVQASMLDEKISLEQLSVFNDEELAAIHSILRHIASCDGAEVEEELKTVYEVLGIQHADTFPDYKEAVELIKQIDQEKRRQVVVWSVAVAYADKELHHKEDRALKQLCKDLRIDYSAATSVFA